MKIGFTHHKFTFKVHDSVVFSVLFTEWYSHPHCLSPHISVMPEGNPIPLGSDSLYNNAAVCVWLPP